MSLTLDQVLEETRTWPQAELVKLVELLNAELHGEQDSGHDDAWRSETRRRVEEIESGVVTGIPGDEVSARIRQALGS